MTKEEHWAELQKKAKVVVAEDKAKGTDAWFHFEFLYEEEAE